MTTSPQAPGPQAPKIDTSVSHSARIWNYWLGGKDNYPVDQQVGDQILAFVPELVAVGPRRPVLPGPCRPLPGRRRASGSSWTSAPACRPWTTPTRSPSGRPRSQRSSTSTMTRWSWCTRAPC